jgi:hypothetical protein
MQPVDYLENIEKIMADQNKSPQEKFDSILKLFRKDLSALMYFPEWWIRDYPITVQALRDDLRRGFSNRPEYRGE